MAPICEANKSAWPPFAKSDVEPEVELTLQETKVFSGSLAIQTSIDKGHDFVSCVDELTYPSPAFIIGVCLGNLTVDSYSRFGPRRCEAVSWIEAVRRDGLIAVKPSCRQALSRPLWYWRWKDGKGRKES